MIIFKNKLFLTVIALSTLYWLYLLNASQMTLGGDAAGYEQLGRSICDSGWAHYFKTGPNREPIYPALIALSMQIAPVIGCGYQKVLTFFQINLLLITQIIFIYVLSFLNIHPRIIAITALYLAFSPAIINSTFSLYSEIAAVPISIGALYALIRLSAAVINVSSIKKLSIIVGLLFAVLVLVKAAFEVIAPLVLISVSCIGIMMYRNQSKIIVRIILAILISGSVFAGIVHAYKSVNYRFNGNCVVTDRASWALYGNTMRRMEPMSGVSVKAALLYVAGEGVCHRFSQKEECYRWSFSHSDDIGMPTYTQLMRQGLSVKEADRKIIVIAFQEILKNPFQYSLFYTFEAMKMFFWESTQIGFVQYPQWLATIYDNSLISDSIRLAMFLLTFFSVLYCLLSLSKLNAQKSLGISLAAIYLIAFIAVYALFYILTRYALPISPIFLVFIAVALNLRINHVKKT